MLATEMAQLTEILVKHHHTPKHEDKSSESFANPFFGYWHRTESADDTRWESRLRIDTLEF